MEFTTPLVNVMTLSCDLRRSRPGGTYHAGRAWIGLPLSGVFTIHARADEHVIHPAIGVYFPRDIEYRMSHPTDDGDTALAIGFEPALAEEAFAARQAGLGVPQLDPRIGSEV